MRRILAALFLTLASIGLLQAAPADAPGKPDWTGFYIGVNAGGGWGSRSFNYTPNDPSSVQLFNNGGRPPADTFNMSGALGGLQFGYNWRLSQRWLAGFEADLDASAIEGSASGAADITGGHPVIATLTEKLNAFGTVRARFGYLANDNLLLFVTGGLAYAQVERSGDYTMISGGPIGNNTPPVSFACFAGVSCFSGATREWVAGWTLGGGVEFALTARMTIKAEYLHASFVTKNITETARVPFPGNPCCTSFNANLGRSSFDFVRIGANYRF